MRKLSQPSGAVLGSQDPKDSDSKIIRSAILVHAGPNGEPVEFMSGDGPIKFDEARIKHVVEVHNARLDKLSKDYPGQEIPMGAYEPILDSHDDSSNTKIIGRLTGKLKFEYRDVPKVGKHVPCAVAEALTFLGKDTVERVKDGRIYHLSIGINENDDSLGETSTVAQPAAAGAMLLSQVKQRKDNGGSKMSGEVKKLQAKAERLAKLSEMKQGIVSLVSKTEGTQKALKLEQKKSQITHRLKALCQAAKMMPSEYKSIVAGDKLTKLAALDQETLDIALSVFDAREKSPIHLGQYGSTASSDAMEMGRALAEKKDKDEYRRLQAEVKKDMVKLAGGKRLFKDEDAKESDPDAEEHKKEMRSQMSGPKEEEVSPGKDDSAVPGQAGEKELAHHMAAMAKHLEDGDMDMAKKCHAQMAECMKQGMKHMSEFPGDVKSEDEKAHQGDLQSQLDEVKTTLSRMAGMVQDLIGGEEKEEHFGEVKEHGEVEQA